MRRLIVISTILCAGWLLISVAVAYLLTHRLTGRFAEPLPSVDWGRLDSHRIATRDGEEIGAWFVDGRAEAPSVLVLHGHKGHRRNSLIRAKVLASQGYAVLMITLRGHGDSTGHFDDIGFGARHDVIAAVEFLEARRPGRSVIVDGKEPRKNKLSNFGLRNYAASTILAACKTQPPLSVSGRSTWRCLL